MSAFEDTVKTMIRNTLLGRWAAERLGRSGSEVEAYVQGFAQRVARDGDVFTCLRDDLAAEGVTDVDDEITRAITDCTIQSGNQLTGGGGGSPDAAAAALKKQFMSLERMQRRLPKRSRRVSTCSTIGPRGAQSAMWFDDGAGQVVPEYGVME